MNTIGRSQSPGTRYRKQNVVQLHRQLQKSDPTENIRDKQIVKDIQVHTEGHKVDLRA